MRANQVRLYFSSFAYVLLSELRRIGLAGTEMARAAGDWILKHPFDRYNAGMNDVDRYHYGAFYCSVAMFQLGGHYWAEFFPRLAQTLTAHQSSQRSWASEALPGGIELRYGNVYTSALAVLALTTPNQLLPVFQR